MPAWGWIVVGAALLGAELLVPSDFFLVFLGLAALAVGLVGFVGPTLPAWAQWTLFAVLAVVSLVGFRRRVRARFAQTGSDPRVDDTLAGFCSGGICGQVSSDAGIQLLSAGGPEAPVGGVTNDPLRLSGLTGGWTDRGWVKDIKGMGGRLGRKDLRRALPFLKG